MIFDQTRCLVYSQLVSLLGSSVARFGVGVWVYEKTGAVADFAVITLAAQVPSVIIGPLFGPMVDRKNKQVLLLVSDMISAAASLSLFALFAMDSLSIAAIVAAILLASVAESIQWPAFSAGMVALAQKSDLSALNGIVEAGRAAATIGAPVIGALLLANFGLASIFLVEIATFLCSIAVLAAIRIPVAPQPTDGESFWHELLIGWKFIRTEKLLMLMLFLFAGMNFFASLVNVLVTPHALGISNAETSGVLLGSIGVGMLLSGAIFGFMKPKKLLLSLIASTFLLSLCFVVMGLVSHLALAFASFFLMGLFVSWVNICSQLVWQLLTPMGIQGRVFSLRRSLAWAFAPLGTVAAVPLSNILAKIWPQKAVGLTIAWAGGGFLLVSVIFSVLCKPHFHTDLLEKGSK